MLYDRYVRHTRVQPALVDRSLEADDALMQSHLRRDKVQRAVVGASPPGISGRYPPAVYQVAGRADGRTVHYPRDQRSAASEVRAHSRSHSTVYLRQTRSVTWIRLVQGRWLLAASSDSTTSVLSVWSVSMVLQTGLSSNQPPRPQAEVYLEGPVSDGCVDVQGGQVVIALEIRSLYVLLQSPAHTPVLMIPSHLRRESSIRVLRLAKAKLTVAVTIVELARIPGLSRIRCLRGDHVGFALYAEVSIPCIFNWRTGVVVKLRERPNHEVSMIPSR